MKRSSEFCGSRICLEKLCKLNEHLSKVGSSGTFLVPHRTLAFIRFLFLIVPECLMLYLIGVDEKGHKLLC